MRNYNPQPKAWSWSYSKLKNYRTCPFRYHKIDVLKEYVEPEGPALKEGNEVHGAFADRIGKGILFPEKYAHYEEAAQRLLKVPGKIMVEQKLAITADFRPCTFFDKQAWYRAIADFLAVNGPVALGIDYKTGKILEDSEQLGLLADTVFSHYPEVQAVRTEFWWLKDDAATKEIFYRKDRAKFWQGVMPKVNELKNAHDKNEFPPKPSGLCKKFCAVTGCPHHGIGSTR